MCEKPVKNDVTTDQKQADSYPVTQLHAHPPFRSPVSPVMWNLAATTQRTAIIPITPSVVKNRKGSGWSKSDAVIAMA
jgi:hypothetical protein